MIPKKLDYTKDECRSALRHLELQAYSSVVSTFRAQGSLDSNKQSVLDQLKRCFHISEDRHKAEIRRVANNEKLTTISEIINGKSFDLEWIREGHRSYPLISRAPSYSALHLLADHASKFAAFENSQLEMPSQTKREHLQSGSENDGGNLPVIVVEDQTKPPSTATPAIFGISKKDLKRSIDMVTAQHSQSKKKHFHLKPPPPPPNAKIQHLYQTLNTKRPRKPFAKKSSSKTKVSSTTSKQSPVNQMASSSPSLAPSSRLQFSSYSSMMPSLSSLGEKFVDGVELQKHLTSQTSHLMPPPMSPILKLNPYTQSSSSSLPTTSSSKNLLKINHMQPLEPQAHYIPNNRLKSGSEILNEQIHHYQQQQPSRARSGRSKSTSSKAGNYSQKYSSNGGASLMRNNSTDHIPDPQIIFNTSSTLSTTKNMEPLTSNLELTVPIESNDMDLSPAITSPLQLLSTAASCTPKLKVNTLSSSQISNLQQFHHSAQLPLSSLPAQATVSTALTSTIINHQQAKPNIQNRAIKIIPANAKLIKAHQQSTSDYLNKSSQQQQQQTIIAATPSKFKIQKIQLVMNKNQDPTNLSPSATIVSGKAGQLVLSGKGGITNTYQVSNNISSSVVNSSGLKSPYTIINSGGSSNSKATPSATAPKVIVQTIDRNQFTQKDTIDILESQRITENTPIDFFLPVVTVASSSPSSSSSSSSSTPIMSFPKVIIPTSNNSSATAPKQIKLKLSPGNIVNSKMFKNLKIQRNINTKGFTVLNTSQIVQIQQSIPSAQQIVASTNESTKTDWEQELDDANRSKAHLQIDDNNMIIEESTEEVEHLNEENSSTVYVENLPQVVVEEEDIQMQETITASLSSTSTNDFLYLNESDTIKDEQQSEKSDLSLNEKEENGNVEIEDEMSLELLNGQLVNDDEEEEQQAQNGAEAYENLVKSLTECDNGENFSLIDGNNMLDTIYSREGLFQ